MKMMMRKLMSWLCCAALVVALLPAAAAADGTVAVADFVRGKTLVLTQDSELATFGVSLTSKGEYKLDLNGHTLTGTKAPFFSIGTGVTLTVCDSADGGTILGIDGGTCMIDVQSGGKFVLESGTLTGHTSTGEGGAICNAGTVEIKGGTISDNTAEMGGGIFAAARSVTTVSGGTITGNTAIRRGGGISSAERNLSDESMFPELNITGGTITGNRTKDRGATLYFHTSKINISGGTIGSGLVWDASKEDYTAAVSSQDSWLRASKIALSGGTIEELTIRPENGYPTDLTISGNPVVESMNVTLTIGETGTTSLVGNLTGGAYVKSTAELTVAEGDKTVQASGKYCYESGAGAPVDAVVENITNVAMQPGSDITKRNFTWFSRSGEPGYITYAKTADMNGATFPANAGKVAATRDGDRSLRPDFYNNKATVTDLQPGTAYSYQLSNGTDTSPVYTFEVGEKTDEFQFLFLGDPQLGQPSTPLHRQKAGWDRTLNQLATDPLFAQVDLVVGAGDQITANADHPEHANMYDAFLNNQWMPSMLYGSLVGNHDNGSKGDHYQHFNEPGYIINPATGEYYGQTRTGGDNNLVGADYWYTYNSILFVCLNVNDMSWGSTAQAHAGYRGPNNAKMAEYHLEFIDKVLDLNKNNKDIQWKIVVYHESPYGSSYHNNYTQNESGEYATRPEQYMFVDMRRYLLPGIQQRGFDVVLSGHDHTYTRTHVLDHNGRDTYNMYVGNEVASALYNTEEDGANYYTYADGTTSPTFVTWSDLNGVSYDDLKLASLPVKVTAPSGLLHITAASSSGSSRNSNAYVHPYAVVTNAGTTPDRQAILVEVTPNTLTFTNYGLGSTTEDFVLADNVLDTFTIERENKDKKFADTVGHWAKTAVDYVVANGIMSGYSDTKFGPDDTLTRAMVVQVLYNKEGQPDLNGLKHSFSDVSAGQWYNNAVTWGSNRGVVSGFGGGVFKPEDAVTIEQVAVILCNYSGTPEGKGDLSEVGNYSDWAANALRWCVERGLLDGVPFTDATEKATRAQTAQLLMNFCETLGK